MDKSLKANCIGEFLGTALLIFFGVGCVAALKVAGASFGLWGGGWALHLQYMQQRVYLAHI